MIGEGAEVPTFELPAVVDGEIETLSLEELPEGSLAVLVFYPGDFNPACTEDSSDLDRLDVFGLQQDATVVGISADSVYSHQVFADQYNITMPLLADVHGEVAEKFGITVEDEGYANKRAVFIIDADHTVNYTWSSTDVEAEPPIDGIQQSFAETGDLEIVRTAYREGREQYDKAWNAWIEAMVNFQRRDWVLSRKNLDTAAEHLTEARESFHKAMRFSETEEMDSSVEFAQVTTQELGYAVDLFIDAAAAHANKNHNKVSRLKPECEVMAERVRTLEPLPPTQDLPFDRTASELERRLKQAEQIAKTDLDEEEQESVTVDREESTGLPTTESSSGSNGSEQGASLSIDSDDSGDGSGGANAPSLGSVDATDEANFNKIAGGHAGTTGQSADWTRHRGGQDIDDDELEAISAEIEAESEKEDNEEEDDSGFRFGAK